MASRDLTRKFVAWRALRERRPRPAPTPAERALIGGYASDASDIEGRPPPAAQPALPPVWVDVVEAVEADVARLEAALRDLRETQRKRLMVSFDDAGEAALDRDIERRAAEATRLFRACERTLKRVAAARGDADSDGERAIRANVQRSVAMKVQALNTEFRKCQRDYLGRLRAQRGGDSAAFDFLSGGGGEDAPAGAEFTEGQLAAVVDVENLVEERDAEIRKIAESIQELSSIFKELAVLVIDQGTILDRIDFNMEQVSEHTRKGVVEIEKAERYQKAARPRVCIALLLFLICIMMVALILKHRNRDDGDKEKK